MHAREPAATLGWLLAGATVLAQQPDVEVSSTPGAEPVRLALLKARAEAGEAAAQTRLADFFALQSDFASAAAWYLWAARQGHLEAQLALAGWYLNGQGVEPDPREAACWLRLAAARLEGATPEAGPPLGRPCAGQPAYSGVAAPPAPGPPAQTVAALPSTGGTTVASNAPPRAAVRVQRVLRAQPLPPVLLKAAQPLALLRATP